MNIGTVLNIFDHWDENKKVMSEPVVDATSAASNWMRKKADEVSHGLQNGYQDMVTEATSWLKGKSPEFAHEAIDTLGKGYGNIGGKVLSFLDPVAYGLDIAADVTDTVAVNPFKQVDNVVDVAHGKKSVKEGLKTWGKSAADSSLAGLEVAATVVPAGYLAGKAAKVPIKAAKKEIKRSLKATTDLTERKALKHDLHINRVKGTAGVSLAKNSARASRQIARDKIVDLRNSTREKREGKGLKVPQRDWNALEEDLRTTWNQPLEEVETWNRNRWKRK